RMSMRSLNVPGSPSAPFPTAYRSPTSGPPARIDAHLRPVGKPAPPRPRNPARSIVSTMPSGPSSRARTRPCPPSNSSLYSSSELSGWSGSRTGTAAPRAADDAYGRCPAGTRRHASLSSMDRSRLRAGLRAGAVAGVLSGAPSTAHAVATGRSPFDSVRAAGTLLLPVDAAPGALAAGGVLAHGAISLGWGVVLAPVLPRRHPVVWGVLAGLAIPGLDLGVLARRWPRIRALPTVPQVADHVAYGALVGFVLSRAGAPR